MLGDRQRFERALAAHCGDLEHLPPEEKDGLIREIFTGKAWWRHFLKPRMLGSGCAVILLAWLILAMRQYVNTDSLRELLLSLPFVVIALAAAFVSHWLVRQLTLGIRDAFAESIVEAYSARNRACSLDSAKLVARDIMGSWPERMRWREVPMVVTAVILVLLL